MSQRVNTYPEMNHLILGILRLRGSPIELYAAQRIEELEAKVIELENQLSAISSELLQSIQKPGDFTSEKSGT
jgi:hypothetical protein